MMHRALLIFSVVPCVTTIVFYLLSIISAWRLFRGHLKNIDYPSPPKADPPLAETASGRTDLWFPPVTLLKPLYGLERESYENLASFCRQDYPNYQIIFGVKNPQDPVVALVHRLRDNFPNRQITLVITDASMGANPKVSQLIQMVHSAAHSVLLLSDSDIRVGPDYVRQVVQPLADPAVGAVTCLSRSIAQGFMARMEALRIATEFSPGVLVARFFGGIRFGLGSTIAFKKESLKALGGFQRIADYLADDFMLGFLIARQNQKVVLSSYSVDHLLEGKNWIDLIQRQIRWARGIRMSRPAGYRGLFFTYGVPMSILLLFLTKGALWSWFLFLALYLVRCLAGWIVGSVYLRDETAQKFFWLAPLNDIVTCGVWYYGFCGRRIHWCGQLFDLNADGRLTSLETIPKAAALCEIRVEHENSIAG